MTFDVPVGEDTGQSDAFAPGEEVVSIALLARENRRDIVAYAGCVRTSVNRNPNPGFGVVPAAAAGTRRIIDERRPQVGRDLDSLRAVSKRGKRAKR